MHWVRSLKSKLMVPFYFSFSLDQEVSFQAAWYYLPVSLSHKNIHNKFENKKQKMSKLCVFHVHLLLFLLPQCIENFFLVDNISNFFAFYFFLVCTFFSNTTISIALWWVLSLEQTWCLTAQLITSLLWITHTSEDYGVSTFPHTWMHLKIQIQDEVTFLYHRGKRVDRIQKSKKEVHIGILG